MSHPKAQAAKEKGNQAFKAADYPTAIGHYTSAILADRNDATFPLNRAAAYLKLGKYEDAERDCTTVLGLSKNNVKALFRRGQARVGLGKLLEAQKDFTQVLRLEPSNTAAQEELKNVAALIQKEKAKKSKSPISPLQSSLAPETVAGKRRRVPIKIVDPFGSGSIPSASVASPSSSAKVASPSVPSGVPSLEPMDVDAERPAQPPPQTKPPPKSKAPATPPTPTRKPDTLEAISSRSLKTPSTGPAPSPTPGPSAPAPAVSSEPSPGPPPQPKPTPSFKDAKEARDTSKPSRVAAGGGIFRRSGENTIFASRGGEESAAMDLSGNGDGDAPPLVSVPVPSATATATTQIERMGVNGTGTGQKPPPTLFEFARAWWSLRTPEERWGLINTVPPAQIPALFKTSLEPPLLVSILDTFLTALQAQAAPVDVDDAVKGRIKEYMDGFTRIPRFGTLVLFLSRLEKEVAREVWRLLGVEVGRVGGAWKGVA